jgi:hypothetical protein
MLHPEKQWLMEAIDQRDGTVSFFAIADIRQWIIPDKQGCELAGIPLAEVERVAA